MNYKTMCSIRMSVAKCVHESRFNLRSTRNVSHSGRSNLSAQNKSQKTANSPEPNFSLASFIFKQPNNANTSEHTHTYHSEGWQVNPNIIWTDAWARPSHRFGVRERRKKGLKRSYFRNYLYAFSIEFYLFHVMCFRYTQWSWKFMFNRLPKPSIDPFESDWRKKGIFNFIFTTILVFFSIEIRLSL